MRCSVAARWWAENEKRRRHWDTTQHYYNAFLSLSSRTGELPDRQEVVSLAGGRQSTFYTVSGPNALHSLLARYQGALPGLAALYPAPNVAAWLGHETAVWAYWPHRTGWLRSIDGDRDRAARALLFVLADFAAGWQGLMRASGGRPPMCAVEDFAIVLGRGASPETLYGLLARLLTSVAAAPGMPPEAAADSAERELDGLLRRMNGTAAQARLAEAIETVRNDPTISGPRLAEIGKMLRSAGEMLLTDPGRETGADSPVV
ncbi:hypothetical protein FXF51_16125 [Nonomuraea sp. PA05]|uniref:hypothetical protein n=1 Tax=Nonomuraea sp. PA05 TaxID=2604466 RepID=UPI0011D8676B|nr:hypothetical protein [Nonomuraea sp. PA05]TYB66636.1 hypothetical protein FXF51_16125 [Nonomuraea sp. PA05]